MNSETLHSIIRRGFLELFAITKDVPATYPELWIEHETEIVETATRISTHYHELCNSDEPDVRTMFLARTRRVANKLLELLDDEDTLRFLDEDARARATTLCAAIVEACNKLEAIGAPNAFLAEQHFREKEWLAQGFVIDDAADLVAEIERENEQAT